MPEVLTTPPEITIDDEPVQFNGDVPENPEVIYQLIFEALAGERKSLVSFVVDGVDVIRTQDQQFPPTFTTISGKSLTHAELTLELVTAVLEVTANLQSELKNYSHRILSTAWDLVFGQMDELIEKVKPIVNLLDNLKPYADGYHPTWEEKFTTLQQSQAKCFEKVYSGFQRADLACISETIFDELCPLIEDTFNFLNQEVVTDLKAAA